MKPIVFAAAMVAAASTMAATPKASEVAMTQANNKLVSITYKLDAPAIVTFDILTNGHSIGAVNLTNATGDVNRRIDKVGETCTIKWQPKYVWPGRFAKDAVAEVTAWSLVSPPDYMVVSMTNVGNIAFYPCAEAIPGGVTSAVYKTRLLVMRRIHAAGVRFKVGSINGESSRVASREVPHDVTFTNDYYIGVYPLTQKQLELVQGSRPSRFYGCDNWEMRPAENFSYNLFRGTSASKYVWSLTNPSHDVNMGDGYYLGAFRRFTGIEFDLPTEAQWEVACRAGTASAFNDGTDSMDEVGWHSGNWQNDPACASNETHVVGLLEPNRWGLYDMHGNVGEMCLDWFSTGSYYSDGTEAVEPPGAAASREAGDGVNYRVVRGGTWSSAANDARSARKGFLSCWSGSGAVGVRLCCPVQIPSAE